MELLGDAGHVKSHFILFGDGVSVSARQVHGLHQTAQKPFWTHPMEILGDEAQEQARFGLFRDTANLDTR